MAESAEEGEEIPKQSFFDIGKFGVPVAVGGLIYMYLFSPLLLPGLSESQVQCLGEHRNAFHFDSSFSRHSEFFPRWTGGDGELACDWLHGGRSWSAWSGWTLSRIRQVGSIQQYPSSEGTALCGRRGQHIISAVGPEFVIAAQDILYFTGSLHLMHCWRRQGAARCHGRTAERCGHLCAATRHRRNGRVRA